jgi:hypothetical protein
VAVQGLNKPDVSSASGVRRWKLFVIRAVYDNFRVAQVVGRGSASKE